MQRLHDEQGLGALIITHYQRILHYVKPEFVHILMDGRIVLEGGVELVERLEREGYDQIRQEVGGSVPEAAALKPGRHREASLYHALAGAGAGDGRSLAAAARGRAERLRELELPVWRRSGFWTTSLQSLDLDALDAVRRPQPAPSADAGDPLPDVVARTLPDRARAGRIVQSAGAVVHVELDPELAERGVILCSLEDAFREHAELVERGTPSA